MACTQPPSSTSETDMAPQQPRRPCNWPTWFTHHALNKCQLLQSHHRPLPLGLLLACNLDSDSVSTTASGVLPPHISGLAVLAKDSLEGARAITLAATVAPGVVCSSASDRSDVKEVLEPVHGSVLAQEVHERQGP